MEEVIVVYKTDNWHSYSSRDIIGIATNESHVINIIQAQAYKEDCVVTVDDIVKDQTQGYEGDGEFAWEVIQTNILV